MLSLIGPVVVLLLLAVSAEAQSPRCIDPAVPLIELARAFEWQPSERSARRAFPALQNYLESGAPRANREAALAYRAVLSQDPHDSHARAALALLYALGPDLNYPEADGYRHVAMAGHSNAAHTGARMLREAVLDDFTAWLHAVALTRIALALPNRSLQRDALTSVERALQAHPEHTGLRLALRDLHVLAERYGDAREVANSIAASCVPVRHARAEAMILNGDSTAGVRLYLTALEDAAPHELHRFEDDISTIITRAQRAAYRSVPAAERARWIRAFWEHNAAASGRTTETRIVDQLQRAAWANANDRSPLMRPSSDHPVSWATDTMHRVPWGPRGILYMRHGPPHRRLRAEFGRAHYEGWVYFVEDRPWTFLFSRGEDDTNRKAPANGASDLAQPASTPTPLDEAEQGIDFDTDDEAPQGGWRLVGRPSCRNSVSFIGRFRPERMLERVESGDPLDIRELYVALSSYDPRYAELARSCAIIAAGGQHRPLTELTRTWARENEVTLPDLLWRASAVPPFETQLRVVTSAYQFLNSDGEREVVAVAWIPSADLFMGTDSATRELRITWSIADSIIGSARTDESLRVPASARGGGLLSASTVWSGSDATGVTLRVVAVDAQDSMRAGTGSTAIALHDPGVAGISDLVLAGAAASGSLVRGDYSVSPLPNHAIDYGVPVRVFFELYDMDGETPVDVSITVTPVEPRSLRQSLGLEGSRERTLSFTTDGRTDHRGVSVHDFDLGGDLEPGTYTIRVTATSGDREMTRSTRLIVLPGEEG